jgi:tetratricopeptide (TPR) repeat protein
LKDETEEAKAVTYEALEIYRENVVETNIKVGKAYLALGKIFYHSKALEVANEYLQKSLHIHLD